MTSALNKMFTSLGEAVGKAKSGTNDDITVTYAELHKWARKYNRNMLELGRTADVIPMAANGIIQDAELQRAFAIYSGTYIKNRQPQALYRNAEAGMALVDDAWRIPTIKTKTRIVDEKIPKAYRGKALEGSGTGSTVREDEYLKAKGVVATDDSTKIMGAETRAPVVATVSMSLARP